MLSGIWLRNRVSDTKHSLDGGVCAVLFLRLGGNLITGAYTAIYLDHQKEILITK